ncbi:MAG: TonB-dependent receptor, partial [bacterium]
MEMRRVLELVVVVLSPCVCWAAGDSLLADSLEGIPVYEMPGITVTATRVPSRLCDVPLGTQVITAEDIEQIGADDAGELLRTGVGIDMKSYGYAGSVSSISIRGSTASQVLVLLDDRPVNSVSLGTADLSEAALSDVGRVEVVRGPASSLYGANALGGVVNIITNTTTEKPSIRGLAEFGSFGKQVYSVSTKSFVGGIGLNLSTYWRRTDGDRDNGDYDGRNVSGKVSYGGIEWLTADLTGALEWFDLGLPGPVPPRDSVPLYGNEGVTSLFDRQKNQKGYADLSLEMKLGGNGRGRAKFYYDRSDMDFHAVYRGWDSEAFTYFKAVEDDKYLTAVSGANLQIDAYCAPKLRLVVGLDASISSFNAT